jgi:hypothetical protein
MTEAVTITNEELAILCDIVAGWSVKQAANLGVDRRQALDRLIAPGYVAPADSSSLATYQHTAKTEVLFAQLCVGISGAKRAGFVQTPAYLLRARRGPALVSFLFLGSSGNCPWLQCAVRRLKEKFVLC